MFKASSSPSPRGCVAAVSLACAQGVLAQASPPAMPPVPAAEPASAPAGAAALETIVVTAQKRSEDVQKVPITIQSYNTRAIESLGIRSSSDLGAVTPNVSIALPSGAAGQPVITIRGIGLNDFNSNNAGPNGVYVDEVYISAPGSQTFQIFDLERIEVLKGPQGTLYGRNTSGGAINFISAKPSAETTADLKLGISSWRSTRVEGALGGALGDSVNARLAFIKNDSKGYFRNAANGQRENGADDYALRGQLAYAPAEGFSLLANVHGGQVDTRPNVYRHIGTLDPASGAACSAAEALGGRCVDAFGYGTPQDFYSGAFNRQEKLRVSNLGGSLRVEASLAGLSWTSITAFERNTKFHPEDTDAGPSRLVEVNYGVRSNTFTQELRAAQDSGPVRWVAGLYHLQETLRQDQPVQAFLDFDAIYGAGAGNGLAQIAYTRNRQTTRSQALFGQGDYVWTDMLKLTLGGRYTTETKRFDTAASSQVQSTGIDAFGPVTPLWTFGESTRSAKASGRLALSYAAGERLNLYGSVASGFKSGGFNGGFLSADPTEARAQLGPVKPENVTAYELGLKSELFERRLQLNVAVFYNDYQDMQVFNQIPPVVPGGFNLQILTNAPKAHTTGVDLQLLAKPTSELTATLNLGLLSTRIDRWDSNNGTGSAVNFTGNRLPLAPRTSLQAVLDYRRAVGGGEWSLQFDASYRARQYFDVANDPLITQDAYWLANARTSYTFGDGRYEAALFVRNLFDKQYLVGGINLSNPFGLVQQVVGTPRAFGATFTYRF
jgi:iron complex outermembrane receptor protein